MDEIYKKIPELKGKGIQTSGDFLLETGEQVSYTGDIRLFREEDIIKCCVSRKKIQDILQRLKADESVKHEFRELF